MIRARMDDFRSETNRILEELLDSNDELVEFMVLDQAMSNFVALCLAKHEGSKLGRRKALQKERQANHDKIWKDYFDDNPMYSDTLFR